MAKGMSSAVIPVSWGRSLGLIFSFWHLIRWISSEQLRCCLLGQGCRGCFYFKKTHGTFSILMAALQLAGSQVISSRKSGFRCWNQPIYILFNLYCAQNQSENLHWSPKVKAGHRDLCFMCVCVCELNTNPLMVLIRPKQVWCSGCAGI